MSTKAWALNCGPSKELWRFRPAIRFREWDRATAVRPFAPAARRSLAIGAGSEQSWRRAAPASRSWASRFWEEPHVVSRILVVFDAGAIRVGARRAGVVARRRQSFRQYDDRARRPRPRHP